MPDLQKDRLTYAAEAAPEVKPASSHSGGADSLIVLVIGGLIIFGVYWGLGSAGIAPRYQIIAAVLLALMLIRDVIRQARERRRRPPPPTDYQSARR